MRIDAGPLTGPTPVLAVPVAPGPDGPQVGRAGEPLRALGIDPAAILAAEPATGKAGEVVAAPVGGEGVALALLVGVGDGSTAELRRAAAALVRRARDHKTVATTLADRRRPAEVRAIAEAMALAAYHTSFAAEAKPPALRRVRLVTDRPERYAAALARAGVVADAVALARDLTNTPSLTKSPAWLAAEARRRGRAAGVEVTVLDEKALARGGFGGILAVGAGSSRPPRLVELRYRPAGATRHVVLIGKGITFDSGGLSLKPNDAMVAMKTDMAGAAAVIATMTALRRLEVGVAVTGLTPLAENLPSGSATRPGDVIRHYGGRTSEVLNTDAEGRLVLADALAYAVDTLHPDAIVDLATLTGAASLGLGRRDAPLYATDPRLRDRLLAAADAAGERLWPMPLVDDYRDALDSPLADLRNIADPAYGYSAGSIIAALFLREFTGGLPWAHLDIAGPARADADEAEVSRGATGFGVRTLCRWLEGPGAAG